MININEIIQLIQWNVLATKSLDANKRTSRQSYAINLIKTCILRLTDVD